MYNKDSNIRIYDVCNFYINTWLNWNRLCFWEEFYKNPAFLKSKRLDYWRNQQVLFVLLYMTESVAPYPW